MDYRCSSYCKVFSNINKKKEKFLLKFKMIHPRSENYYKYISQKKDNLKKDFLEIFNYKCVYCGNSVNNLSIDLFEIDHFISKSCYSDEIEAGKIDNLVSACQSCNSLKNNFINLENFSIFDIEIGLPSIFERNSDFYIKIKKEYKDNSIVRNFYDQLHLGYQTKRIDYILLELYGLVNDEKFDISLKNKLMQIYILLKNKRNFFSNYS